MSFLYISTKNDKLLFECFDCKNRYSRKFNKNFKKKFKRTYEFCNQNIDKFMFLLRKGVYPYEYMDDWNRFDEEKIPNKSDFYSNLNKEEISDIDYRHSEKVFDKFNIKNLREYHDLYVQSDTIQLCDAFENFRNICLKVYELDPVYFLSCPGLAWQACLKKTGVNLELISDVDMLLIIENGIRGGICQVVSKNEKANNKYMKNYDDNKESSYLQYLDANSSYVTAMCRKLPVDGFEWLDPSETDENFIKNYDEESNVGYFIEVDIEYPENLQKLQSDLPFLPEGMKVDGCKKLICNFYDKKEYADHIVSLKQALNNGLILKKIYGIIKFNQKEWLKEYVDLNTELRKNAKNDFEKDFCKLMSNACFGKTMENVRNHRDIRAVTDDNKRNKLVREPNYHTKKLVFRKINSNRNEKASIKLSKPIYLGLSLLSLSKTVMYEFWYDYSKPKYGENVKLCYMDTDSFIMHIKTKDFYEDIANDVEKRFDTSNYFVERPLPTGKNKKVPGLMKDELGGKIMVEFFGLRPKCYAYLANENKVDKRAKGTKKCVIKGNILINDYKKCLKEKKK